MSAVGRWIADILDDIVTEATNKAVQAKVIELCGRLPCILCLNPLGE